MQLGSFEIPEVRLVPNAIADVKIIYDHVQSEQTKSKDLASYLGYSHATASRFYLRLNALVVYGLLEGRGNYKVSELGKILAYPENERQESEARTRAVFNVGLWKEIYNRYKKSPPRENFWVHIKNITGIEPKKAQDVQSLIMKWYTEDIAHVSEKDLSEEKVNIPEGQSKGLSSNVGNNKSMSQILEGVPTESFGRFILPNVGYVDVTDEDTLEIARSYLKVLEKKVKSKEIKTVGEQVTAGTEEEL